MAPSSHRFRTEEDGEDQKLVISVSFNDSRRAVVSNSWSISSESCVLVRADPSDPPEPQRRRPKERLNPGGVPSA